jgi:ATP-dependent Clp protease adaptor protein ClpS
MPVTLPSVDVEQDVRLMPRWQVVLLNDDDHTYDYVIEMLMAVFQMTVEQGFRCACEVDKAGRSVVDVTTRERAELKREQIHAFGPDPRIPRCKGAMSAIIEPVE